MRALFHGSELRSYHSHLRAHSSSCSRVGREPRTTRAGYLESGRLPYRHSRTADSTSSSCGGGSCLGSRVCWPPSARAGGFATAACAGRPPPSVTPRGGLDELREELTGVGFLVRRDLLRGPGRNQLSPLVAALGSEIDDPVGDL